MTALKTITRKEFVRKFRALGFEGPKKSGAYLFMRRGAIYLRLPEAEILQVSIGLQQALLKQLEIDLPVWERA